MARRLDNEFCEGTVLDRLATGSTWWWERGGGGGETERGQLMPFGSGGGLAGERRQRVAPAFILNNFLMRTAIPSNDLSRVQARPPARPPAPAAPPSSDASLPFVQMVVRDGADVNCTDGDGNSPLNLAVSNGASVALIQFLSRAAPISTSSSGGLGAAGRRDPEQRRGDALPAHPRRRRPDVDLDACGEERRRSSARPSPRRRRRRRRARGAVGGGGARKYARVLRPRFPALLRCVPQSPPSVAPPPPPPRPFPPPPAPPPRHPLSARNDAIAPAAAPDGLVVARHRPLLGPSLLQFGSLSASCALSRRPPPSRLSGRSNALRRPLRLRRRRPTARRHGLGRPRAPHREGGGAVAAGRGVVIIVRRRRRRRGRPPRRRQWRWPRGSSRARNVSSSLRTWRRSRGRCSLSCAPPRRVDRRRRPCRLEAAKREERLWRRRPLARRAPRVRPGAVALTPALVDDQVAARRLGGGGGGRTQRRSAVVGRRLTARSARSPTRRAGEPSRSCCSCFTTWWPPPSGCGHSHAAGATARTRSSRWANRSRSAFTRSPTPMARPPRRRRRPSPRRRPPTTRTTTRTTARTTRTRTATATTACPRGAELAPAVDRPARALRRARAPPPHLARLR